MMNIVLFTTRGAASGPDVAPVEKVNAHPPAVGVETNLTPSCATLSVVIWSSELNRVLAKSFAARTSVRCRQEQGSAGLAVLGDPVGVFAGRLGGGRESHEVQSTNTATKGTQRFTVVIRN